MTAAQLTALIGSLSGLLVAIGSVVALWRHKTGPAHRPPGAGK